MRRSNSGRVRFGITVGSRFLLAVLVLSLYVPFLAYGQATPSSPKPPVTAIEANINPVPEGEALVTLYVNGALYGDAEARIDLDDPFLRVELLKEVLQPYLTPQKYAELFAIALSKLEWAGIADLRAATLDARWDSETLSYYVSTPSEYAERVEIDFSPRSQYSEKEYFKPSFISASLNMNGNANFAWTRTATSWPLSLTLDGLIKVWKIAFEGGNSISWRGGVLSDSWSKSRAVVDMPGIESRFTGGRVTAEGIAFQSRPELYGATMRTLEVFSRYDRNTSPSVAFILQQPATVRIVANGQSIRTLKLDKGNYRVYDLPFTYGLNEFQLEIEEPVAEGVKVFRPLRTFISTETGLLVGGRMEYGLSGGVGFLENDQPFGSGFFRYGLAYDFTGGVFAQADARSALAGIAGVYSGNFGGISFDVGGLGAWDGRADPWAMAAEMRYGYTFSARPALPTVGFTSSWASKGFTAPSPVATVPTTDSYFRVAGNVGYKLAKTSTLGLSASWNRTLTGTVGNTGTLSMNFGLSLNTTSSLSLSGSVTLGDATTPEYRASVSLYSSGAQRPTSRVSLTQNLDSSNTINYSDRIPELGGLTYGIQAQNPANWIGEQTNVSANASISSGIGDASLNSGLYWGGTANALGGSASLGVSTALSFAGGSIALSRPLSDAFIIFDPDRSTGSMPIEFATESSGKVRSHGGPVALSLSSYRPTRATMDFPEADADITATIQKSLIVPEYRSGFLFRAGLLRKFYVSGRLLDATGKPVGYVAGEIMNAANEILDTTFTDEDGSFQSYGLVPGTYTIVWPNSIGTSVITLENETDGYIELGDISATPAGASP